ncbi:unnamed protein product [Adineta steineri]|uniref:UNC93-like protein n=1 Tax=Adineta steineri TaxID=433720 RepID=A0A819UE11_9BILA|nr:unnamed protein product [Adineta steineri]
MIQISSDNSEKGDKSNKNRGGKKRNLSMICLTFLCAYTSFNAVANLQSSINIDKNVGLYSLAILSGGSILSSILFTTPLIYILGYKWTIVAGQIGILIYIAANMYPKAILLYPAQIWGNLITYFILRNVRKESRSNFSQCGANFVSNTSEIKNDESTISPMTTYILYSVFVGIICISIVFVIIFLDQKRKLKGDNSKGVIHQSIDYSLLTLKQFKKLDHWLLIPIVFWINSWEAFIFWNLHKGLVMASYGITASIVCVIVGYVAKIKYSRPVCLLSATSVSIMILMIMLLWKPVPSQTYMLYVLACIAGITAVVAKPLVSALYSHLFADTKEMVFSIFSMIQNLGCIVVYFYSPVLIVRVSIILQIIYTSMAMICYITIETRLSRK